MKPVGCFEAPVDPVLWPLTKEYSCLGHVISPSGAVRPRWSICKKRMWRAFFKNFGRQRARGVSDQQKLGVIQRAIRSQLSFRCSVWPPQRSISQEMDALQRKMVSIACRLPRHSGESPEAYALRRGRHARKLIGTGGTWSRYWFARAVAWSEHISRGRGPCKWNRDLLEFHNSEWLQGRRIPFATVVSTRIRSWSAFAGRTATRAAAGKVQPRWEESVRWAKDSST